jgi:hypothetical protein
MSGGGAVRDGAPDVVERDAPDQLLVVLDHQATAEPVVEALLHHGQEAFGSAADERAVVCDLFDFRQGHVQAPGWTRIR